MTYIHFQSTSYTYYLFIIRINDVTKWRRSFSVPGLLTVDMSEDYVDLVSSEGLAVEATMILF